MSFELAVVVDPEKAASGERTVELADRSSIWVENGRLSPTSSDDVSSSVKTSPLASAAIRTLFSDQIRWAREGKKPGEFLGRALRKTMRPKMTAMLMILSSPNPPFNTCPTNREMTTAAIANKMTRSTTIAPRLTRAFDRTLDSSSYSKSFRSFQYYRHSENVLWLRAHFARPQPRAQPVTIGAWLTNSADKGRSPLHLKGPETHSYP